MVSFQRWKHKQSRHQTNIQRRLAESNADKTKTWKPIKPVEAELKDLTLVEKLQQYAKYKEGSNELIKEPYTKQKYQPITPNNLQRTEVLKYYQEHYTNRVWESESPNLLTDLYILYPPLQPSKPTIICQILSLKY